MLTFIAQTMRRNLILSASIAQSGVMLGLWLIAACVFALSSSGRIDMIDGQYKYEVSQSLALHHDVKLRDNVLLSLMGNPENPVSFYPLGSSIPAVIPVALALGGELTPQAREHAQFLWTLTIALIGALLAPTMFYAWRGLGFSIRTSALWSGVTCFATMIWPLASSSFDHVEHAWFLLLSALLAYRSTEGQQVRRAVLSGLCFSAVLHYQPAYVVLLPALLLTSADFKEKKLSAAIRSPLWIFIGAIPGMLALAAYNYYRFGSPLALLHPTQEHPPIWGNTLLGALTLTISPGKGIFLFSPVVLIALLGLRAAWSENRRLAVMVASLTGVHFVLVSSLLFAGGDWCWGPRYLVTTLPLLCLLLPYGMKLLDKRIAWILITLSMTIQLLGLSIDHHRFFFNHNLTPFFWANNPTFYFSNSQLMDRPRELLQRSPEHFSAFSSGPYRELITYAPFGPPPQFLSNSRDWAKQFAVFHLPRPWPLWMSRLPSELRFINVTPWVAAFLGMGALGGFLILWILARVEPRPRIAAPIADANLIAYSPTHKPLPSPGPIAISQETSMGARTAPGKLSLHWLFLFACATFAFWSTTQHWMGGLLLELRSLAFPTLGAYVAWTAYALWGALAIFCLAAYLYQRLNRNDWDGFYHSNRLRILWGTAAAVFMLSWIFRVVLFDRAPFTDDETAYLFAAKILQQGHLWLDSPLHSSFYDRVFIINDGRMMTQYYLGWPVILAVARTLHLQDVINPLFCALSVIPLALLLERYCRPAAVMAGLICYGSSMMILISAAGLLAYTSCLFFLLWYTFLNIRIAEDVHVRWLTILLAVSVGAIAFFIRPSSTVLVGTGTTIYALSRLLRGNEPGNSKKLMLWAGAATFYAAAFLLINRELFGDFFTTGYQRLREFSLANGYQFINVPIYSYEFGMLNPRTLLSSLASALQRLTTDLLGWPLAALLFLPLAFLNRRLWPHALAVAAVILVHVALYDFGTDTYGPVHFLESVGALIVLIAFGIQRMANTLQGALSNSALRFNADRMLISVFIAIAVGAWSTFFSLRTLNAAVAAAAVNRPLQAAEKLEGASMVFYSKPFTFQDDIAPLLSFVFFAPATHPALGDKILWVNDLGDDKNQNLIKEFPDRHAYRLQWTKSGLPVFTPIAASAIP